MRQNLVRSINIYRLLNFKNIVYLCSNFCARLMFCTQKAKASARDKGDHPIKVSGNFILRRIMHVTHRDNREEAALAIAYIM